MMELFLNDYSYGLPLAFVVAFFAVASRTRGASDCFDRGFVVLLATMLWPLALMLAVAFATFWLLGRGVVAVSSAWGPLSQGSVDR